MTTTYELYTNENGTPKAVEGKAPAIIERVEALETDVTGLQSALDGKQAKGDYATTTVMNTELAKKAPVSHTHTTAQVTGLDTALAGKEDKGTCLPLTGGTVLGDILSDPASRDEMFLGHSFTGKKGAFLALRADNHAHQQGTFVLGARLPTKEAYLQGNPTGELMWNGSYVVTSPNTTAGVIRLSNGLQVCWGLATTSDNGGAYVSFGSPFSEPFYVVNANISGGATSGSGRNNWTCGVDRIDTASMNLWAFNNGTPANNIAMYYTAIGYWTVN